MWWLIKSSFNAIAFYLDIGGRSFMPMYGKHVDAKWAADMLAKEGF